jgi:hypothetical protein
MHFVLVLALSTAPSFAVATFSNGEKAEGAFSLTEGRKMDFFDVIKQKRVAIDPEEIARISVNVEEESMQQAWMFKEDGNAEKIMLPWKYPIRKLLTDVTLTTGQSVHGHVVCPFYLEDDQDSHRYFLVKDQKGEKNQSFEDLTYIKEVVLPNRKVGDIKLGTITVKAAGNAILIDQKREMTLDPPFTSLLSGQYDVLIFNDKTIRFGLSGDAVPDADKKAIQEKVDKIEEFYTSKKIVAFTKAGSTVRGLVELTRKEESYDKGFQFARWELWTFEPTKQSFDVKRRLFLFRQRLEKDLPTYEYKSDDKLKGVNENATVE